MGAPRPARSGLGPTSTCRSVSRITALRTTPAGRPFGASAIIPKRSMLTIAPSNWIRTFGEVASVRCFAPIAMRTLVTRQQRSPIARRCRMIIGRRACSTFRPETSRRSRPSFAAGQLLLVPDARADGFFLCQTDDTLIAKGTEIDRLLPPMTCEAAERAGRHWRIALCLSALRSRMIRPRYAAALWQGAARHGRRRGLSSFRTYRN